MAAEPSVWAKAPFTGLRGAGGGTGEPGRNGAYVRVTQENGPMA